ncbi:hypothetical protein [Nocardia fusca]|uniref:Alpha/beta hydrolase n=1 Tax=Nocardia fusca TaxID=941183 RepID=A0ABV3FGB3_9NOCA
MATVVKDSSSSGGGGVPGARDRMHSTVLTAPTRPWNLSDITAPTLIVMGTRDNELADPAAEAQ